MLRAPSTLRISSSSWRSLRCRAAPVPRQRPRREPRRRSRQYLRPRRRSAGNDALFEAYFEDTLRANPLLATYIGDHRYDDQLPNSIGPEYLAAARAMNRRYLEALRAIDPAGLSPAERISYDIFLYERERELRAERFPFQWLPVNQAGGLLTVMPALGSGTNAQPFATVQDYDNWLKRLDGLAVWIDQAVVNMREGMAHGVVQPRVVMEKVLVQLEAMDVPRAAESPLRDRSGRCRRRSGRRIASVSPPRIVRRSRSVGCRRSLVSTPSCVTNTFRARGRASLSALPDGEAWYAYYVQEHTTTGMTPGEIHEVGLGEVRRILGEMDGVRRQVGFQGDLEAFFKHLETDPQFYYTRGEDLLDGYRVLKQRIDAALPRLFAVFPRADYEVREVEAFRAQSAAGAYYQQASADGSRPGIFYVNTYNLRAQPKFGMETLSLHEASPGHHFQVSIPQEVPASRGSAASAAITRRSSRAGRCTRSRSAANWACSPTRTSGSAGSTTSSCAPCASSSTRACTRRGGRASRRSTSCSTTRRWRRPTSCPRSSATSPRRARRSATRWASCDQQAAPRGGARARAAVRRAGVPPGGARRRRGSDGRAAGEGRALDRRAPLTMLASPLRAVLLLACAGALGGCDLAPEAPVRAEEQPSQLSAPLQAPNAATTALYRVVETYFDQYLALNPITATKLGDHRFDDRFGDYASMSWMADSLGIEQESLERLQAVDPRRLSGEDLVTYEAFRRQREIGIAGYRYPSELLAIDPFVNWPLAFAQSATAAAGTRFRSTRDYDAFLLRMDGFSAWVDQAINNLRAGLAKGVVLPKVVVTRTLPQLEAFGRIEDPRQSVFWQPLLSFPAGPTVDDRRRLLAAYEDRLRTRVLPAYRRLHDYLAQEYLPQARDSVAWSDLPSGDLWYAHLVRLHTDSTQTPDEVHLLGVREVARLRANLDALLPALGPGGDPRAVFDALRAESRFQFADTRALLDAHAALQARVDAGLPALFARLPQAAVEIRPVEAFRAGTSPAVSSLAPDAARTRAAVIYVNTGELADRRRLNCLTPSCAKRCRGACSGRCWRRRRPACRAFAATARSRRSTRAGRCTRRRSAWNSACTPTPPPTRPRSPTSWRRPRCWSSTPACTRRAGVATAHSITCAPTRHWRSPRWRLPSIAASPGRGKRLRRRRVGCASNRCGAPPSSGWVRASTCANSTSRSWAAVRCRSRCSRRSSRAGPKRAAEACSALTVSVAVAVGLDVVEFVADETQLAQQLARAEIVGPHLDRHVDPFRAVVLVAIAAEPVLVARRAPDHALQRHVGGLAAERAHLVLAVAHADEPAATAHRVLGHCRCRECRDSHAGKQCQQFPGPHGGKHSRSRVGTALSP